MSHKQSIGPDPSQWSNSKMTGVGLSIAGGLAGAVTASIVNAAQARQRPVRVISAKAAYDAEIVFLRLDLSLMQDRLKYSQRNEREANKRAAELEEALWERDYRARY